MKIASINVNGMRRAVERGFLDWLKAQDADIVCVQNLKTKSFELDDSILYPEGYEGYFLDAEQDDFAGVGIYCRRIPKAIMYGLGFEQCDNEGRFLQADYERFSVASFLMPEDPHAKQRFIAQYSDYLARLRRKRRQYIIAGSWYIAHKTVDLDHWSEHQSTPGFRPEERAFMDQVFGPMDFVDTFREVERNAGHHTWWQKLDSDVPRKRQDGWRMDYQITGPDLARTVKRAWIDFEADFSEFAPLIIEYDLEL